VKCEGHGQTEFDRGTQIVKRERIYGRKDKNI